MPLTLLHFQHNSDSFSGLMWSEFIDQVMHVDEEDVYIVDLVSTFVGIWAFDENVQEVEEVNQYGVVELLQFSPVIKVLWIETTD